MPNHLEQLSHVFHALGDPTRRKVLERCGLVRSRKAGRVRTYRLTPKPLKEAEHWMTRQRAVWERRLDQLDNYLLALKDKTP